MKELRFGVLGTGFWARYQIAGWYELPGVRCVALYNRTRGKAEALARQFNIPAVYDTAEELIERERPDFLDIITDVATHRRLVELAAAHQVPVICQKPMAPSLADAQAMVECCQRAGVPLAIHENWRWQAPIRCLKSFLKAGRIGRPFRARIDFVYSFPVFDNQPFLRDLDQFILTDIGSHILDTARFLFGEAESLSCLTHRIHQDIRGEDVATVMMRMGGQTTVVCNMSYASRREGERYPETYIFVEGEEGSIDLGPDFVLRLTTRTGTVVHREPPKAYPWVDPAYIVVQSSIVDCNADLLRALQTGQAAETHGTDNLRTVQLVFGAYDSAREGREIHFNPA